MARTWSKFQEAIFTWVTTGFGFALVEAVAGSGKTTTLVEAVRRMVGSVAVLAFNKKIAVEIGSKLVNMPEGVTAEAGTFHSFGLKAWTQAVGKVKVDANKSRSLIDAANVPDLFHAFVAQLVSLAKQRGLGIRDEIDNIPMSPEAMREIVDHFDLADKLTAKDEKLENGTLESRISDGILWAIHILRESIKSANKVIDFDDMLYMPLVRGVALPKYNWVLVDEAQDTNPARRIFARRMVAEGGRGIFVGDSRQAIYGFTGADADSMDLIARDFNAERLPLTVTYRCPKSVVRFAQQWVNHIEAAETSPEGLVEALAYDDFDRTAASNLRADDAILCRNTAPLVKLAFSLIRRRIPCHVEGRDIGAGLVALARRWKVVNIRTLSDRLDTYLQKETEKWTAKKQEMKVQQITDKVDTLRVIMDTLPPSGTVDDVVREIQNLFGDSDDPKDPKAKTLTLSTIHKSKGREWARVFWLGRDRFQPSPYAKQEWQQLQETNLMYVAATRAMAELYDVEAPPKEDKKDK